MIHPITHDNGQTDRRYSIDQEFAGQETPVWVARFCGEFIGSSISYSAMVLRCVGHNSEQKGALIITEQRGE